MAGHRALEAVAVSVVGLLNREVARMPELAKRPNAVLVGAGAPQLGRHGSGAVVLVHPYRVEVDESAVAGRPGVLRPRPDGNVEHPPTSLRLHLLVTATGPDPEAELAALGLAVDVLAAAPALTPETLDPVGEWSPDELVVLSPESVEATVLTDVFAALGMPARPALGYQARGIVIGR